VTLRVIRVDLEARQHVRYYLAATKSLHRGVVGIHNGELLAVKI
jgi:hypothetical protein